MTDQTYNSTMWDLMHKLNVELSKLDGVITARHDAIPTEDLDSEGNLVHIRSATKVAPYKFIVPYYITLDVGGYIDTAYVASQIYSHVYSGYHLCSDSRVEVIVYAQPQGMNLNTTSWVCIPSEGGGSYTTTVPYNKGLVGGHVYSNMRVEGVLESPVGFGISHKVAYLATMRKALRLTKAGSALRAELLRHRAVNLCSARSSRADYPHMKMLDALCERVHLHMMEKLGAASTGAYALQARYGECGRAIRAELSEFVVRAITHPQADDTYGFLQVLEDARGYYIDTSNVISRYRELRERVDGDYIIEACDNCGEPHIYSESRLVEDGEARVCESCVHEVYRWVPSQDDYYHESDVHYWESDYEYHLEPEPEPEPEPEHIFEYSEDVLYHHDPDRSRPESAHGDFLMGIELETMPLDGWHEECAEHLHYEFGEDYAILKEDGSLDAYDDLGEGIEIVTAPRFLEEHIRRFKDWRPDPHLRAWDTNGKCGMHVHISVKAFTKATLGKFIEFINAYGNKNLIRSVAGRYDAYYCSTEDVVHGNPVQVLSDKSDRKYCAVNTGRLNRYSREYLGLRRTDGNFVKDKNALCGTVELRIFRATLKKERLLAQIEFAHAAVVFSRFASMRYLTEQAFREWLKKESGQYPNLARWLGIAKKKNLRRAA